MAAVGPEVAGCEKSGRCAGAPFYHCVAHACNGLTCIAFSKNIQRGHTVLTLRNSHLLRQLRQRVLRRLQLMRASVHVLPLDEVQRGLGCGAAVAPHAVDRLAAVGASLDGLLGTGVAAQGQGAQPRTAAAVATGPRRRIAGVAPAAWGTGLLHYVSGHTQDVYGAPKAKLCLCVCVIAGLPSLSPSHLSSSMCPSRVLVRKAWPHGSTSSGSSSTSSGDSSLK